MDTLMSCMYQQYDMLWECHDELSIIIVY